MFVPGYSPPTSIPAFLRPPCSKVRTPSSAWNFWPLCNTWACDRQTLPGSMIIVVDRHTGLSETLVIVSQTDWHFLFFRIFHRDLAILSNRFGNLWVPPTSSLWSSHLVWVQMAAGQRWGDGLASAAGIMLAQKHTRLISTLRLIVIQNSYHA